MGQAYDGHGRCLGSATGQTKQEVFDDLNRRFPDAAEIVIRHRGEHGSTGEARTVSPIEETRRSFEQQIREKAAAMDQILTKA